jgi:hypothetical protein
VRVCAQQRLGRASHRVEHVFAIVEHEQDLPRTERGRNGLGRRDAQCQFDLKCAGHGDWDEAAVGQRRRFGRPNPISEFGQTVPRGLEAEPGLADASRVGEG